MGEIDCHQWYSSVGLFTQFLNLGKWSRMILGVRVPPAVCKMASPPLDFHQNKEAGYYHAEDICCLPESSPFCVRQILKSMYHFLKVKILPNRYYLWYNNFKLPAVVRPNLWYTLSGSHITQISQYHLQIPLCKSLWKHCQFSSDFCKGKSCAVFSWHGSLTVSTYLQQKVMMKAPLIAHENLHFTQKVWCQRWV